MLRNRCGIVINARRQTPRNRDTRSTICAVRQLQCGCHFPGPRKAPAGPPPREQVPTGAAPVRAALPASTAAGQRPGAVEPAGYEGAQAQEERRERGRAPTDRANREAGPPGAGQQEEEARAPTAPAPGPEVATAGRRLHGMRQRRHEP